MQATGPGDPWIEDGGAMKTATAGIKDTLMVLLDTARLRSGFELTDQAGFAARMEKLPRQNLQVDEDAEIEIEPEYKEDEEDGEEEEYEEDEEGGEVEKEEGGAKAETEAEEASPKDEL